MSTPDPMPKAPVASLRNLFPFLRPYRPLIAAWLGFLALSSVATLSLPVAVRLMIDHGFSGEDPSSIDRWFVGLLLVAGVLALATAGRFYFVALLGERVVADLRQRLFTHLMTLDMAFFERTRSGELVSRLSADTELLRSVVGSTASVALRSVVTALGSAVMLAVTSPRLAAFASVGIRCWCCPSFSSAAACRNSRAAARTVWPTPTRGPARRSTPCTPCRATRASRTRCNASPRPCATPSARPGAASAPRPRSPRSSSC